MKLFMTVFLMLLGVVSFLASAVWLFVVLSYGPQAEGVMILLAMIAGCFLFVFLSVAVAKGKSWAPLGTFILSVPLLIVTAILAWMISDIGGVAVGALGVLFFALAVYYKFISKNPAIS